MDREFEDLEPSAAPGGPAASFSTHAEAEAFASWVSTAGVAVKVVARDSHDDVRYFEFAIVRGTLLQLDILFRLHHDGVSVDELSRLPAERRMAYFRDGLHSSAVRRGAWRPPAAEDLSWYAGLSRSSLEAMRTTAEQARSAFVAQHRREGRLALWLGLAALGGGAAAFQASAGVGLALAGTGAVFLAFAATRKRR